MNKGSVHRGLMINRIHQKGVTAQAGGKPFGEQKLELGHGRVDKPGGLGQPH